MQEDRLVRLGEIIGDASADPPIPALIPISKTSWYAGVKSGAFPKPVKLGPRTSAWRLSELLNLIAHGIDDGPPASVENVIGKDGALTNPKS